MTGLALVDQEAAVDPTGTDPTDIGQGGIDQGGIDPSGIDPSGIDPSGIDPSAAPSGTGCLDCERADPPGWWFHLRRCARCGHVGCCDSSPAQHATAHAGATGHPVVRSFEPGEEWFWDYRTQELSARGPELAPPEHRPTSQPAPGPAGRVPADWAQRLHA